MAKAKGLSLEQHQALGKRLKAIREDLLDVSVNLSNSYGVTKAAKLFGKKPARAYVAVDELRSIMENALHQDCPELSGNAFCNVYYGGR